MISDINGVITLNSKESLRFEIICRYISGTLNRDEAARLLNISIRTITRISKSVQKKGLLGVKHGNLGKIPHFKYEKEFKKRIISLFKEKYFDFNLSHSCYLLEKNHEITVPY